MYAIIDLNGKQVQVEEGRYVYVDRLPYNEGDTVDLENVLMVVDGKDSLVGAPTVDGAAVKAKLLSHRRGPKTIVYKMRCKKGYRRKNGHRQELSQLQIDVIEFPGKKASPKKAEEKAAPAKAKPAKKADEKAATVDTPAKTAEKKPAEKKPTAKKPAADKTDKKEAKPAKASTKASADKADKPAKAEKSATEKKPAAKKTTKSKADKPEQKES
ncbi:MAG: 50S ribosomal protein L21 [Vampirovibrio sp.]|nr:50S ribosomal protein L21 [Vampirovibrio sp.]